MLPGLHMSSLIDYLAVDNGINRSRLKKLCRRSIEEIAIHYYNIRKLSWHERANALFKIFNASRAVRVCLKSLTERNALVRHKSPIGICIPGLLACQSGINALHWIKIPNRSIRSKSHYSRGIHQRFDGPHVRDPFFTKQLGIAVSIQNRMNRLYRRHNVKYGKAAKIFQTAGFNMLNGIMKPLFTLLARGYTSTRIQKELYIAAGIVNYYSRNIYAKLGVHSKQELIAMFEETRSASHKGVSQVSIKTIEVCRKNDASSPFDATEAS